MSYRLRPAKKLAEIQFGFKKDSENLLKTFAKKESHSFEIFSEIWKEKHFSLVYKYTKNFNEISRQTQLFLFEAKKLFIYAPNIYIKTGAFYLLYGLYYKQPLMENIKIRLTQNELKLLKTYINEMKNSSETHPMYIFSKLINDQAFDFVFTQLPLIPKQEPILKLFDIASNDTFREDIESKVMDQMKELIENEGIAEIGRDYRNAMKEYFESSGEKNIMMFDTDIQKELEGVFMEKVIEGNCEKNDSLGKIREELKKKAAGMFKTK
ncbi:snRNA-activating protein complex subunit 1 [Onthophagus taurus]|uniref:snRNA-activating protein complex subunit 1 n=1 Tax=Onthophagus taurus TaxID=166361 RepID=UPI0039BEA6BD